MPGGAEGRIISLAHPVAMGGCFLATLYAGYTGLQWRMLRELGVELKEAKAAASAAQKAVQEHAGAGASDEEAPAPPPPSLVQAASDADAAVAALTEKRSVIQAGNFRDRHYQLGTILLAVGIPMALEGPVNTYMRAGKLFPGPHVYAGVGVASLWGHRRGARPGDAEGQGVGAHGAHRRQRRDVWSVRLLPDPDGPRDRGQGHREDEVPRARRYVAVSVFYAPFGRRFFAAQPDVGPGSVFRK